MGSLSGSEDKDDSDGMRWHGRCPFPCLCTSAAVTSVPLLTRPHPMASRGLLESSWTCSMELPHTRPTLCEHPQWTLPCVSSVTSEFPLWTVPHGHRPRPLRSALFELVTIACRQRDHDQSTPILASLRHSAQGLLQAEVPSPCGSPAISGALGRGSLPLSPWRSPVLTAAPLLLTSHPSQAC